MLECDLESDDVGGFATCGPGALHLVGVAGQGACKGDFGVGSDGQDGILGDGFVLEEDEGFFGGLTD